MLYAHLMLVALAILSLCVASQRQAIFTRGLGDWAIDVTSLLTHFFLIPMVTSFVILVFRKWLVPSYEGIIDISPVATILGGLLITDYLWYWNHRAFHAQTRFWNLHEVHHNSKRFDIFISPRNTLWSPLFFVYLWATAVGTIVLKDPAPMMTAAAIALVINFWGHTSFAPKVGSRWHRALALVLITPHEHAWHHSSESNNHNFATVFSFWDRLHGTYYSPNARPASFGFDSAFTTARQIFFPF